MVKRIISETREVGLDNIFISKGSMPRYNYCGYQVAIAMILYSTRPGRYCRDYTQLETIRHLRSAYSSFKMSSSDNAIIHLSLNNVASNQ